MVTDPNGNPTTRIVDDKGAVAKVVDAFGHKQDVGYTAAGNVETYAGNNASTPQAQLSYGSGIEPVPSAVGYCDRRRHVHLQLRQSEQ